MGSKYTPARERARRSPGRRRSAPRTKRVRGKALCGAERAFLQQATRRARQEFANDEIVLRKRGRDARHLQRLHPADGFSRRDRLRVEHLGVALGVRREALERGTGDAAEPLRQIAERVVEEL